MRTKLLTVILISALALATLGLASCGFVEVDVVTLHFVIEGTPYCDMSVSAYAADGLDVGEREGYYFDGWYTDERYVDKVIPTAVTEDSTLYGRWLKDVPKVKTYTVTFVANDVVLSTVKAATIADIVYPTPPEVEGMEFSEWRGKPSILTEDCTLTAVYRNRYTVEFVDESGRLLARQQVVEGSSASPPVPPQKQSTAQYSYTFAGWVSGDGDYNDVSGDMVVRPTYTATINRYTYTLHKNNGEDDEVRQVNYGSRVSFAVPAKQPTLDTVYTFAGWDTDGDGTADTTGVSTSIYLYEDYEAWAVYSASARRYTVVFDVDGVETSLEATYEATAVYAGGTPERARDVQYTYTFAGWDTDADGVVDSPLTFAVQEDVHAVAVFDATVNWYTYAFYDVDGSLWGESHTEPYGTLIRLPDTQPEKEQDEYYTFEFSHWEGYTEGMTLQSDVNFTAVFGGTVRLYDITFKINNVLVATYHLPYHTVIDYDELYKPYPFPVADTPCAYAWQDWHEDYLVTKPKNFVLIENPVTDSDPVVTYDAAGGVFANGAGTIVAYFVTGDVLALPAQPTREGHVFAGWTGYVAGTKVTANMTIEAAWTPIA